MVIDNFQIKNEKLKIVGQALKSAHKWATTENMDYPLTLTLSGKGRGKNKVWIPVFTGMTE